MEYNPIQDMIDLYIKLRVEGEIEEKCFLIALSATQRILLERFRTIDRKIVIEFLTYTSHETVCAKVEIEYAKSMMQKRSAH